MNQRARYLCGILFLMIILTVSGLAADIKGLEYQKIDSRLEVMIKTAGEYGYDTFELSFPNRLVVDISPVEGISAEPTVVINDNGVATVRTARFKTDVARIVFDLAEKAPSHRISKTDTGLKIIFWMEQSGQATPAVTEAGEEAAQQKPVILKSEPEPQRPSLMQTEYDSASSGESKYFGHLRGGLGILPKPDNENRKDFPLYGETASLKENYKLKASLIFDASFGKYFMWGSTKIKGGIGITLWALQHQGNYEFTLPHPFVDNSPRTAIFQEDLKNSIFHFYVYGLFNIIRGEKLRLWAGPGLGYATGKFSTLKDYDIEDKSPFSNTDISLTSSTLVEDSVSGLTFSGLVNLEYILSPKIFLIANADAQYFNPKVENFGKRLNFIITQFSVGLQINF